MEIRTFAERILLSESLDEKLERIDGPFTDDAPGDPLIVQEPGRSANLKFAPRRTAPAMPKPVSFSDPHRRAIAHHIMANHELQALEVMAMMLCRFKDAPSEFRFGLLDVIKDEQKHTRMHMERSAAFGMQFGDLPVNCYIWKKSLDFTGIMDFAAGISLTFEGRNLDHTLEFADYFKAAGDERSAAVMRTIHRDEIEHVAFGLEWLRRLKPADQSDWDAYCKHLHWPLRPAKSVGEVFQQEARQKAGMTDDFIAQLKNAEATIVDDQSSKNSNG